MSHLVLDDQIDALSVFPAIQKWTTAHRLRDLRPHELIPDDRVPEILLTLNQPTFVTIDAGFWTRRLCHPDYCILYFALRDDQQRLLPALLRALFRMPEFRTRARRMGAVARVSRTRIDYWKFRRSDKAQILWTAGTEPDSA